MAPKDVYDNHPTDDEWDFYSGLPNPKWYEKHGEYGDQTDDGY